MNPKQPRFYHSLYFKLANTFLLGAISVGLVQFRLGIAEYRALVSEINQSLEWDVAGDIANQIQPRLLQPIEPDDFFELVYSFSIANPKLEFYLLAPDGSIFAYHSQASITAKGSVDLSPIRIAIDDILPDLPLYGEDPAVLLKPLKMLEFEELGKVFSAAPIYFNGQHGYLYIIIEGANFTSKIRLIGQFFLTRLFSTGWAVSMLAAAVLGYLLFRVIAKRFAKIAEAISRYEEGDYSSPLVVRSKDEIGVLAASLNNMARKLIAAKAEIEDRDQKRRQLVALITHDLRSPLTAMQGYLDLALDNPKIKEDKALNRDVMLAADNARVQTRLVDDLFELAKLEAQEREPNIDAIELTKLVEGVVSQFQNRAAQRGIALLWQNEGESAFVLADQVLIGRVFSNLLENALRFTPAQGSIEILTTYFESHVMVQVKDSGKGISQDRKDSLIEMFSQDNVEENVGHSGAGLGLAIVQRILELHQSRLQVESASEQGTAFSFSLPLEE